MHPVLNQTVLVLFLLTPISDFVVGKVFYSISIAGADVKLIVLWLIAGSIFCTFYFNFINLKMFRHALDLVRGRYDKPESKGEVSHFQALSTAISGTVGLGNIAGVAVAVAIGGPGATFWMILAVFQRTIYRSWRMVLSKE